MKYLVSAYSDIGNKKKTNQDSVLVEVADWHSSQIVFGMICDGMGGLDKGELASATVIRAFSEWFRYDFPQMLENGFSEEVLFARWRELLLAQNSRIGEYGHTQGIELGTTAVGLLIYDGRYYLANVGDSRAYRLAEELTQLTKDQTFVQREMDAGRMTMEEARVDARRNMLLQCVGASEYLEPEFASGEVMPGQVYMLCSDGFRHIITEEEIYEQLCPQVLATEQDMLENAAYLTELNKYRKEEDNISVAVIKTC